MKKRIWELDAFRGLCILGMVLIHLIYDAVELYRLVRWDYPPLFSFVKDWGGVLFLLVSGISVTLGSRHIFRGTVVFCCGGLCTLVTVGMWKLGFGDASLPIWFGVLHCLGVCMLLWSVFHRFSNRFLGIVGFFLAAAGVYLRLVPQTGPVWLIPFGITPAGFFSSDYFPLLPNLGFFLLGSLLGRTLYRDRHTLFPRVNSDCFVLRFLSACGRHSLLIYLLHQPVLTALIWGTRALVAE